MKLRASITTTTLGLGSSLNARERETSEKLFVNRRGKPKPKQIRRSLPATNTRTRIKRSRSGQPTKLTEIARAKFLAALGSGDTVAYAAYSAGMSYSCAYDCRKRDATFAAEWDAAVEEGTDKLEQIAYKRAINPKHDTLLMFLLNGRRPDKFRRSAPTNGGTTNPDDAAKAIRDAASALFPASKAA